MTGSVKKRGPSRIAGGPSFRLHRFWVHLAELHSFADESENVQIGGLTIENRLDRVSIYGSIDLTRDKLGLDHARRLKAILDLAVAEMEKTDLPDRITQATPEPVENPFN
jgi:hypothetical protein